jgi:hypothetical protein
MEDELGKLPLRTIPGNYADLVMAHIARAEARQARGMVVLIGAQIVVTGALAITLLNYFSGEIVPLVERAGESMIALQAEIEQFLGAVLAWLNEIRIEPLENLAPIEWALILGSTAIVWLLANGLLIGNLRKEKIE